MHDTKTKPQRWCCICQDAPYAATLFARDTRLSLETSREDDCAGKGLLLQANLENALKQVTLAAGEATPVCQDEERQALQVELLHGVRRLVRAVWEPHLPGLQEQGELSVTTHITSRSTIAGATVSLCHNTSHKPHQHFSRG